MKIFTGEIPENPYDGWSNRVGDCIGFADGQQSILNQCREVDIDALVTKWLMQGDYFDTTDGIVKSPKRGKLSKFIQEQIQQEVKDGKHKIE